MTDTLTNEINDDELLAGFESDSIDIVKKGRGFKSDIENKKGDIANAKRQLEATAYGLLKQAEKDNKLKKRLESQNCRSDAKHKKPLKALKLITGDKFEKDTDGTIHSKDSTALSSTELGNMSSCIAYADHCEVPFEETTETNEEGVTVTVSSEDHYGNWRKSFVGDPKDPNFTSKNVDKKLGGGNDTNGLKVAKCWENKGINDTLLDVSEIKPAIDAAANIIQETGKLRGFEHSIEIPEGTINQYSGFAKIPVYIYRDDTKGDTHPQLYAKVLDIETDTTDLLTTRKLIERLIASTALNTVVSFEEQLKQSLLIRTHVRDGKDEPSIFICKQNNFVKIITTNEGLEKQSMSASREFPVGDVKLEDKVYKLDGDCGKQLMAIFNKKLCTFSLSFEKIKGEEHVYLVINFKCNDPEIASLENLEERMKRAAKNESQNNTTFDKIAANAVKVKDKSGQSHKLLLKFKLSMVADLNKVVEEDYPEAVIDHVPSISPNVKPIFEYQLNKDILTALKEVLKKTGNYSLNIKSNTYKWADKKGYIIFSDDKWFLHTEAKYVSSIDNEFVFEQKASHVDQEQLDQNYLPNSNGVPFTINWKVFFALAGKFDKSKWTLKVYQDAIEMHMRTQNNVIVNFILPCFNPEGGFQASNSIVTEYINMYSEERHNNIDNKDVMALKRYQELLEELKSDTD